MFFSYHMRTARKDGGAGELALMLAREHGLRCDQRGTGLKGNLTKANIGRKLGCARREMRARVQAERQQVGIDAVQHSSQQKVTTQGQRSLEELKGGNADIDAAVAHTKQPHGPDAMEVRQ